MGFFKCALPALALLFGAAADIQAQQINLANQTQGVLSPAQGGCGTSAGCLPLSGPATVGGQITFTLPPALSADPTLSNQAATKHYIDTTIANLPPASGGLPIAGGTLTGPVYATTLLVSGPHIDATLPQFGSSYGAGQVDTASATANQATFTAAIAAAIKSGGANYALYIPPGNYAINGTLDIPANLKMYSESSVGATLIETNGTAPLVRVRSASNCQNYACYGGIAHISLVGQGIASSSSLLEMDSGYFILDDVHYFNTGGRGLQMNGPTERTFAYNQTFYNVRWPIILAGDSNENYFYATNILDAGEVQNSGYTNRRYCYGVNCSGGNYTAAGTVGSPATLYQDPHAAIYVDKAVNVAFYGGTNKGTAIIGGAKIWTGGNIRFENFYHENSVYSTPTDNAAYIVGGKAEQTYLTGALSGSGLSAPVADSSWMPQYYGSVADIATNDYYGYVLLPQDYDPTQTGASSYVSGVNRNQYEIVSIAGFVSDGNVYIQSTGRNLSGSTAPSGTSWPVGTVIEHYPGPYGSGGDVILSQIHSNMIQGPQAQNGWAFDCEQTNTRACGEFIVGYQPDIQALTSNPATNQTGIVVPLGTTGDPLPYLSANVTLDDDQLYTGSSPYTGMVAVGKQAAIAIRAPRANLQYMDSLAASQVVNGGMELSLGALGGSYVFAPSYATGVIANVQVLAGDAGEVWNTNGFYLKQTQTYKPYQQYGRYTSGFMFMNSYCPGFDMTPGSNQPTSRFCLGGGPSNTNTASNAGPGYGYGAEWDYWTGTGWLQQMRAWAGGLFTQGSFTAAKISGEYTVDGQTYTSLNAAWSAAAAAAQSGGGPQTIRLGPQTYNVTATLTEPTNGACVSLVGSAGTTSGADIGGTGTVLNVTGTGIGPVVYLGNTTLTEGCTFRNLSILAHTQATSGFQMTWYRGLLMENVTVNDTSSTAFLMGEASGSHQSIGVFRNLTASYSASTFTPATRPAYGFEAQQTAIDSYIDALTVRNAQVAAFENLGGGWTTNFIHGYGYPYTCTTAPCSNTATSTSAANASFATNYEVEDNGTGGNMYFNTYMDSPAVAAFHLEQNGVQVNGGHLQWPETTSFPQANLADVEATLNTNLIVSNVDCLNMSTTAGTGLQLGAGVWISFQTSGSVPPAYSTVSNLAGCGDYTQTKSGASQTAFERGAANYYNTNPGISNGLNPKIWASPLAGGSNYAAFAAQLYTNYLGDEYAGGYSGQPSNYNVLHDGTLRTSGGFEASTVLVTAATTLTTANRTVIAKTANGAYTITLPSCYTPLPDGIIPTGMEIVVEKADASSNALTLSTVSSQTITYVAGGTSSTATTLSTTTPLSYTLTCGPDNNWYAR